MTKLLKGTLPYLAAGLAAAVATPAVAAAAAAVDWYDWLDVQRRQAILTTVGRLADRLGLVGIGCALRRHASYLPYDQAARAYLGHIPPGELAQVLAELRARTAPPAPPSAETLAADAAGEG